MAEIASKLSTMVGENLKYYFSQMAEIASKLSSMVGENLKYLLVLSNGLNCF